MHNFLFLPTDMHDDSNINLISTPEDYKILEPYSAYVESLARIIYPDRVHIIGVNLKNWATPQ